MSPRVAEQRDSRTRRPRTTDVVVNEAAPATTVDRWLAEQLIAILRDSERASYGRQLRHWYAQLESAKRDLTDRIKKRYNRYREGLSDLAALELATRHECELAADVRRHVEKNSLPVEQLADATARECVARRAHQRAKEHLDDPDIRHTSYDHELWSAWYALQVLGLNDQEVRSVILEMVNATPEARASLTHKLARWRRSPPSATRCAPDERLKHRILKFAGGLKKEQVKALRRTLDPSQEKMVSAIRKRSEPRSKRSSR